MRRFDVPRGSSPSVAIRSRDPEEIRKAVEEHVADLRSRHPDIRRVIWFGSWVSGLPTPGSDVDLCIVVSASEKPMRDRIPDYLPVGFPVGIDLFVYTEEEFRRLESRSPEWLAALQAGKEL